MLSNDQIKQLKKEANGLKAFISIGKNGINENTIMQISKHIKVHKLCKIKIFRSFIDESGLNKKDIAKQLAEDSSCELVSLIGFNVILYKR